MINEKSNRINWRCGNFSPGRPFRGIPVGWRSGVPQPQGHYKHTHWLEEWPRPKMSLILSSYRLDEPSLLTVGCPIHSPFVLIILFVTYPQIHVPSCPHFTLPSFLPLQTPTLRPSYSPNCFSFLAFYPHILLTLPPLTRHRSYPRFRISWNRITLQAAFPTGQGNTKTIKKVSFLFSRTGTMDSNGK